MNINKAIDKAYEKMSFKEILSAPVSALSGVSEKDAEALKSAFNIKIIGDLANNKFFQQARAISILSDAEE
jgi:hypothetical protein